VFDVHFSEDASEPDEAQEAAPDVDCPLPLPFFERELLFGSLPDSMSHKIASAIPPKRLRHCVTALHKALTSKILPGDVTCAKQVALLTSLFTYQHSNDFRGLLKHLFGTTEELNDAHFRLGQRLLMSVHKWILQQSSCPLENHFPDAAKDMLADLEQHGPGAAKLRYVAGSVIARLLYRMKKHVQGSLSDITNLDVRVTLASIEVLKHLCDQQDAGTQSKYPDTQKETADRQYGKLTYISDSCYELFRMLEMYRLKKMSIGSLVDIGGDLPATVFQELCCDPQISQKWLELTLSIPTPILFRQLKIDTIDSSVELPTSVHKRLVKPLVVDIANRAWMLHSLKMKTFTLFMKTASKSFRQHVVRTLHVQKSAAHRIKITQRKKKRVLSKLKKSAGSTAKKSSCTDSISSSAGSASAVEQVPVVEEMQGVEEEKEFGMCPLCDIPYSAPDIDWITCDGCRQWICRPCSDLGVTGWRSATVLSSPWICSACIPFCSNCEVLLGAAYIICIGCSDWFCRACSKCSDKVWREAAKSQEWICTNCTRLSQTC
jgi:hypothetical protein